MSWQQVVLIVLFASSALLTIDGIDEPRKPITTGMALANAILAALLIWMVVTL